MTPWRDRNPYEVPRGAREALTGPVEAAIEAWLGGEPMERNVAAVAALVTTNRYLAGELSPANRERFEERLRTDPKFRDSVERSAKERSCSEKEGERDRLARADYGVERLLVHLELKKEGIGLPWIASRPRYPDRRTREAPPPSPLEPSEFVERLAAELGTHSAKLLVSQAFRLVEATGEPDPWIVEVARARERGSISTDVAHFLIWQLAESAIMHFAIRDPDLSRLIDEIEGIEREHRVEEGRHPARWRKLHKIWEKASDDMMCAILIRTGERTVVDAFLTRGGEFGRGRRAILGI